MQCLQFQWIVGKDLLGLRGFDAMLFDVPPVILVPIELRRGNSALILPTGRTE
jgi:hypothetical protein